MESQKPYQNYMKLSPDDRLKYTNDKKQRDEPFEIPLNNQQYPEINFIQIKGVQDKKPISLATYRHQAHDTKGVVILFHSMGMHTGLSARLAARLASQGLTTVAMDYRGHGKSEGERGYIDDIKQHNKDLSNFAKKVTQLYPNVPLFLLGHGLGALMALNFSKQYEKQYKISGIILACPSLKRPGNSKVLSTLSDFALKIMPNRAGLFQFVFENTSKNKKASNYQKQDPLIYHEKVYVGTLMQVMQVMDNFQEKQWPKLTTPPIAIIQGECDKVADPCNSIKFFESIQTKDKEYWYYKDLWHMFYLQEQYPQIQNRIVIWLKKRV